MQVCISFQNSLACKELPVIPLAEQIIIVEYSQ